LFSPIKSILQSFNLLFTQYIAAIFCKKSAPAQSFKNVQDIATAILMASLLPFHGQFLNTTLDLKTAQ